MDHPCTIVAQNPAPAGVKISGQSTSADLREEFRSFWALFLTGVTATPLHDTDRLRPIGNFTAAGRSRMQPTDFDDGDVLISHMDFLGIDSRALKGKAGASDGVLGEILLAMSAEQLGELLVHLTATLHGKRPIPPSWTHADVTLVTKVAGALPAKQYRPITVLLVLEKLALRVWHACCHARLGIATMREPWLSSFFPSCCAPSHRTTVVRKETRPPHSRGTD